MPSSVLCAGAGLSRLLAAVEVHAEIGADALIPSRSLKSEWVSVPVSSFSWLLSGDDRGRAQLRVAADLDVHLTGREQPRLLADPVGGT